nr:MAG: DNA pilot protein [Microvirus sp.]
MLDSIIGAGLGLGQMISNNINSILDRNTSKENVNKTIAANRELAAYAYSKDLEMWNRANEYNSPKQQMERLADAGLNPNLVYGNGSVVGNTSTATPQYKAPDVKYDYAPLQIPDHVGNFISLMQGISNVDNTKATTENTYKMYDVLEAKRQKTLAELTSEQVKQGLWTAQTLESSSRTNKNKFDLDFATELRQTSADIQRQTLENLRQRLENDKQQLRLIAQQTLTEGTKRAWQKAQTETEAIRKSLMNKDLSLKDLDKEIKSQIVDKNEWDLLDKSYGTDRSLMSGSIITRILDGIQKKTTRR